MQVGLFRFDVFRCEWTFDVGLQLVVLTNVSLQECWCSG
jgi:hypothetical protein